jgi:hypothetical protein
VLTIVKAQRLYVSNPLTLEDRFSPSPIPPLDPPSAEIPWPMSDPLYQPWSGDPYAPQIPYWLYYLEKANFAGVLMGGIFYGMRRPTFASPCSSRLFDCHSRDCRRSVLPSHGSLTQSRQSHKGGHQVGFVAHTAAMFAFATIYIATSLDARSISYIDNRDFPGEGDAPPPGPLGYLFSLDWKAIDVIPDVMFLSNNALADGLLVSSGSNPISRVSNVGCHSSSTVATLYMA